MKEIATYLQQPYPFYYQGKKLGQMSLVIALLAFVFNYLIRPFETNYSELRLPYFWVAFIHSVSPIAVLLPMAYLKARQHAVDNWQVKNEFRFIFFLLLVIGIVQFLLRDILYDNPLNWSWSYLIEEVNTEVARGEKIATPFSIRIKKRTT